MSWLMLLANLRAFLAQIKYVVHTCDTVKTVTAFAKVIQTRVIITDFDYDATHIAKILGNSSWINGSYVFQGVQNIVENVC